MSHVLADEHTRTAGRFRRAVKPSKHGVRPDHRDPHLECSTAILKKLAAIKKEGTQFPDQLERGFQLPAP